VITFVKSIHRDALSCKCMRGGHHHVLVSSVMRTRVVVDVDRSIKFVFMFSFTCFIGFGKIDKVAGLVNVVGGRVLLI
jgi:hypothetical protein